MKSQLQELAISFGKILMPTIKNIVSWIQNLVDKLNNMDEGTGETIVKVGLLVAAIGPLLIVIGKTISTVGKAMQGFSSLGTSILKIVNHAKTDTGMIGKLVTAIGGISAPVVAVVAAIGVLVATFATLWNTNEEFREKITSIWNDISSFFLRHTHQDTDGGDYGVDGNQLVLLHHFQCHLLGGIDRMERHLLHHHGHLEQHLVCD